MDNAKHIPPVLAEKILLWFLRGTLAEEVLGDLEEKFYHELDTRSLFKAKLNYWYQVFNYLRPFAMQKSRLYNSIYYDMYKNYFKIGYRNLLRNKGYSAINIGGLAIGMAVAILIGLWVYDELTFDQYHKNHDRIAQVMQIKTTNGIPFVQYSIPLPLESELRDTYGNDFDYLALAFWPQEQVLTFEDKKITTVGNYLGKDITHMLSMNMLKGTLDALEEPASIILSNSLAQTFFVEEDPMGKMMKINNEMSVMVTGVYEDFPNASSFNNLTFIAPWMLWETSQSWVSWARQKNAWDNNYFQMYAQISAHADMLAVNEKLNSIY